MINLFDFTYCGDYKSADSESGKGWCRRSGAFRIQMINGILKGYLETYI